MRRQNDQQPLGRRERKKQERREIILAVARKAFKEVGFDSASMETIADQADIAPATLYNYFANKSALLSGVLWSDFSIRDFDLANFTTILDKSPCKVIFTLLEQYFRWFSEYDRRLIRQFASDAIRAPYDGDRGYHDLESLMLQNIARLVGSLQEHGKLNPALDRDVISRLIFNVGNSEFYAFISDEALTLDAILAGIEAQIELILGGIL
ncbi:TetR/AcrR family transcriptional regulator [Aquidulcibacter sp.]|uniref:TetR/AcrR family transcriptional regulator n=1 Tax=Aquidulcibacter sp. TaxID=2052990 RepID=UPI0025BAE275|nr:TetR/AcrR family transcriptional regulator [Aquidulcibacter sp.]MCA3697046.1 helix-turn-helix transcriptional regulator [Aquidulcibacter sp.]